MYKSGSAFFSCTTTTRSKNNWFLWATQQLCACIILFSIFLWRSLHDYWVKSPSSTFTGGSEDEHTTTISNFFFNLDIILKDSTPNRLHLTYWPVKIDPIWFKRTQIHFFFGEVWLSPVWYSTQDQPQSQVSLAPGERVPSWYLISRGFIFAILTSKHDKKGIKFRDLSVFNFIFSFLKVWTFKKIKWTGTSNMCVIFAN